MQAIQDEIQEILKEPLEQAPAEAFWPVLQGLEQEKLMESATVYGTPQYFLDVEKLKVRAVFFMETMLQWIPNSHFFYAFKCNDLPYLIRCLRETRFQADVASLFELELALKLGFERIVFNSPGKSNEELRCALREHQRVSLHVDNVAELERVIRLAAELAPLYPIGIGFRLNSELSVGGTKKWSKFGFELAELPAAVARVEASPYLAWTGLHFHTSLNKRPYKYVENIKTIGLFLGQHFTVQQLSRLCYVDIGGGFYPENQGMLHKGDDRGVLVDLLVERGMEKKAVYAALHFDPAAFRIAEVEPLSHFAQAIGEALQQYILPFNPGMAVYFEPGRFIVTSSTTVLLRVVAVKKDALIVDGGIQMVAEYKFAEYSFAPIFNLSRPSRRLVRKIIYGSLCDPHDIWGYSYYGEEAQVGDVLAVPEQGAYTFSSAWRFIKAIPAYIAAVHGELLVAKTAETFENRYAGCKMD